MSNRQLDEEAIFHIAKQLADATLRSTYLDQVCDCDRDLRERVEALLCIHEEEAEFLKSGNAEPAPTVDSQHLTERPGTMIGRNKLMEQIGEGGMGVVFVAEQQKPLQRKVAIKVIRPGMDSKEVIARFDAERQALAMMDHSNIAKVFDAGTTDSGRPYFVMELVRGMPITEYCDERKLTVQERLQLFSQVCQAIQHAHQKGIIHRDIKPTNILVTEQDGKCIPKVIDFGVAKALNQSLTDRTLYTSFQAIVGTPLYMSPEQAALSNVDVDTRSDVYSLGVLLYELLTGTTPFDKNLFKAVAIDEMRRVIRETDPPKPSTKISKMGKSATVVSADRKSDPSQLSQLIQGDLDWIVMKALEKDRTRRFETASSLADDVQRSLTDQPVLARPPSVSYRVRKFVRRNRGGVMAAAVLMTGILIAGIGIIFGWWTASKKAQEAEQRLAALQDVLYQRAIYDVVQDSERARDSIHRAKQAGIAKKRLFNLRGILAFYDGNLDNAIEYLEQGEESVAPLSVLAFAYVVAGDHRKANLTNQKIKSTKPALAIDHLMRAQFLSVVRPQKALEHIEEAEKDLDTSIYTRMVEATALVFHGWNINDDAAVEKAFQQIEAAGVLEPDNSFVLMANAQAHLVKYRMLLRAKQPVDSSFRKRAENHAIRCCESQSRIAAWAGVFLLAELGSVHEAVNETAKWIEAGHSGFAPMFFAPMAILVGEEDRAIRVLEHSSSREDVFTRIALKALQIDDTADREATASVVTQIANEYTSADARMYALHLLLMNGQPALAQDTAESMLNTTVEMELPYKSHIEFLAGGSEEKLLLESPKLGLFDAGLKAYAHGEFDRARVCFLRSAELDIYSCQYWWSRVYLERLRKAR